MVRRKKPVSKPVSLMSSQEREGIVREAVSIIRQDYYADVRSAADGVMERLKEVWDEGQRGEPLRESVLEIMHEEIDGQSRVIYTLKAQLGLISSENDGAYLEEYGKEGIVEGGYINWSHLMFAAMERDVYEELEHRGVDVNDPESFFEEEDEEE